MTALPTLPRLREQTLDLLYQYKREPSIRLRNRLVELNMGLVRQVAHQIHSRSRVPYDDLEQLGSLGLIRAVERFNPQQGCAFSSFAVPYIRGEMLHYLRDQSHLVRIPRRWQTLQRQGQRLRLQLIQRLGRTPTDSEIATELGIPLNDWQSAKQSYMNQIPISLDAPTASMAHTGETVLTLGEVLPDQRESDRQQIEVDQIHLYRALALLESQTRQILEFIFLGNLTRKQAASQVGVSPMTVTRRVQKGLAELNAFMRD